MKSDKIDIDELVALQAGLKKKIALDKKSFKSKCNNKSCESQEIERWEQIYSTNNIMNSKYTYNTCIYSKNTIAIVISSIDSSSLSHFSLDNS